jgi:pimeloyl-ACP methyl ester carboxylesterase
MKIPPSLQVRLGPSITGEAVADDGFRLSYQVFGEGPTVLFATGIGVRFPSAAAQIEALRDRFRVVCWDYRGLDGRPFPASDGADVSMARHAADALAVLDAVRAPRMLCIGWSMGVQVGLEVIRRRPERTAAFVSLLGAYGEPFRNGLPPLAARAFETFFDLGLRAPTLAQGVVDLGVALPEVAFLLLSRAGFVGRDADRTIFDTNLRCVAAADRRAYLRTMLGLAVHDASDVLPRVRCPTLVIAGEHDWFGPPRVGRRMAAEIPGAIYRELPGATHFGLIEQQARVNAWIREFALQVQAGGEWATPGKEEA